MYTQAIHIFYDVWPQVVMSSNAFDVNCMKWAAVLLVREDFLLVNKGSSSSDWDGLKQILTKLLHNSKF